MNVETNDETCVLAGAETLDRRSAVHAIGLGLLSTPVLGSLKNLILPGPANDIKGTWHYRSFHNETREIPASDLLFAEGDFELDEPTIGELKGKADFGGGFTMEFSGTVVHAAGLSVRFEGKGTGPTNKDWHYDYWATMAPRWPNGIDQVMALVGTVVRSAPHRNSSGSISPAGKVASFIAVKK